MPSQHFPYITISLIVINPPVFFLKIYLGRNTQNFMADYGAIPFEITHRVYILPYVYFPVFFTLFSSVSRITVDPNYLVLVVGASGAI